MPLFDGVILLDGAEVPVILNIEEGRIRLSSGGTDIGEWSEGEYDLTPDGDGQYLIAADGDSVVFRPSHPDAFARVVSTGAPAGREPEPAAAGQHVKEDHLEATASDRGLAPPPRPLTRALFFTLAGLTAILGIWALFLLFGAG